MAGSLAHGTAEEITIPSNTPTAITGSINSAASGSTFVVAIRDYSPSVTVVTDTVGGVPTANVYARLNSRLTIGGNCLDLWVCYNGAGGSTHRPVITKTSGDLASVSFIEITGVETTSVLDVAGTAALDSSSPFNVTVGTSNAADIILTVGASDGSAATITTTPGVTEAFTLSSVGNWVTGTNGLGIAWMYKNVAATGTYGANFTQSSGSNAGVQTFALKLLSSGSSIAPSAGGLALTGIAPSALLGIARVPAIGALTLTGAAPLVTQQISRSPTAGSLSLSGIVPSIISGVMRTPAVTSLSLSGIAPIITNGANSSRTPVVGALILTGIAPTMNLTVPSPVAGSLLLTGVAPTVNFGSIRVPAIGALTITGIAPSLTANGNTTITPTKGTLTLTGNAPVIGGDVVRSPLKGSLTLTGIAPVLYSSLLISPLTGVAAIAGGSAVLSTGFVIRPSAGGLAFTGIAPTMLFSSPSVRPSSGSLVFNGYAPTANETNPNVSMNGFGPARRLRLWL
jgi:hypothetical protein